MPIYYEHLDARTRRLMLDEMNNDVAHNRLHISPYLSGQGLHDYPALLREAIETGTDETLAAALKQQRRLQRTYQRARRHAGYTTVAVPANAADVLAESEFNRYYIRALARRAIEDGISELVVFRAKPAARPRPESERALETTVDPNRLLEDLRSHPGEITELGIPAGPGSGISVRLP